MPDGRCDITRFDVNTSPCFKEHDVCDRTWIPRVRVRWTGLLPQISFIATPGPVPGFISTNVKTHTQYYAQFNNSESTPCTCCEFRQLIKGQILLHGFFRVPIPNGANGTVSNTQWKEDIAPNGAKYGHRGDQNRIPYDAYLPQRADGCIYMGTDTPRIDCLRDSTAYNIDIRFISFIRDTCAGVSLFPHRYWRFRCQGVT